jgi:cation:H+ antiporter
VALGIILLAGGLVFLTVAADRFVDHSIQVAAKLRISPVVVGAVVVGFGTSAPELLVSGLAARQGDVDVGVGNILGSNMANITLVLGVAAIIRTISVTRATLRREAPVAVFAVLGFAVVANNGLSVIEGCLLLAGLVIFFALSLSGGVGHLEDDPAELSERPIGMEILMVVVGLAGTVAGAQLMVNGAIRVADGLGLSGGFVGLTILALGTSLPELVTAITAARKGQSQLIIGNLLGSNIFNSLAVGGSVALLGDHKPVDDALVGLPLIVMCLMAILAWGLMLGGRTIARREGVVLLFAYVAVLPFLPR